MSGGQEPANQAQEIEVTPAAPEAPRTGLMMAGALAVLVVAVVGAYFAASGSNDDTEVDVAAPEAVAEETQAEETEAEVEEPVEDDAADVDEAEDEAGEDAEMAEDEAMAVETMTEMAADSAVGFGGPSNIVHIGGEFISLGLGPDGPALSRSADGTEWASTPVIGIPDNGNLMGVVEVDGSYVSVVEVWPEYDEESESAYFGTPEAPDRFLATSSDLVNWELSELPAVEVEEGGFSHVSGIAASGSTLAILVQVEPAYIDETRILFEAGLLTEADMENFCGTLIDGPDDPIIVQACDWDAQEALYMEFEEKLEAAESDEARMALEEEFFANGDPGTTEMLRIEPGDPVHSAILDGLNSTPDVVAPVVLSGPIDGLTVSDLPVPGYASSIVGTDAGFLSVVNNWEDGATSTVTSADGSTWSVGASLGTELDVQGLAVVGEVVVAVGNRWDSANSSIGVWATSDLGATWTETEVGTDLFNAYGMPIGGPAGVAISLEGSTEPYPENFGMPDVLTVISDGYTLEVIFEADLVVLTDPDGAIVHEIPGIVSEEPDDEIEGVLRFEGRNGSDLTFLDPETGEDLVTFSEDDFIAADAQGDPEAGDMEYVEPPRRTEVWFSTDGITWTVLESTDVDYDNGESWTSLAGVGDDEVLMRTETWVEPPMELWAFEEENREPTEEEIAALDAWESSAANVEWRRIAVG